ncbi:TldD/PmbA family protein [Pseudocnuella soli]|uniref:TldD/PmbA family protein n=1 Tax=Pseudocnuella soli TaxID=2502779 RepID=UPI0010536E3E|nr:TldD/PmbA family protein [Pseudocnuella soli]
MKRADFLRMTSMGVGALVMPNLLWGNAVDPAQFLEQAPDNATKKALANAALAAARAKGATYADVRISRYLQQNIATREAKVQSIANNASYGVGIRVIAAGSWGFAATNNVTKEGIAQCAAQAVAIAKANASLRTEPVYLVPQKGLGDKEWKTPIEQNPFDVPVADKVALLMEVNNAAMKEGASFITSNLSFVNEQKYYASTDGTYVAQDIHRLNPVFSVTVVDRQTGKFKTRDSLSAPMGRGWEYLEGAASEKLQGPAGLTLYRNKYDMVEDAVQATRHAKEKHKAKSVAPGKYDLVLDPTHLGLTIHESIGHPLELDRVLGYEANYAGTSFATLDKWKSGNFNFGSDVVNVVADRTQPFLLNTIGFDDDGVPAKEWDLIQKGILVNYQATRDQVHLLGQKESHGCSHADSWGSVQFQRMPNVSLRPGKEKLSPAEMIRNVEKGIYILGRGSYSIDQQRYNFQFGGQLFFEISNGEITGMLEDVAYQSNTQEFWNACVQTCDAGDYRSFGTFNDGKGQPGQASAVSHGCSTTRFNGVNVINTQSAA